MARQKKYRFRDILFVKGLKPMLTRLTRFKILASSLCVVFAGAFSAQAQEAPDSEEERLAKQLANPVAALISVPFQFNYDSDIGSADDGERATLNVQPVNPITLNNGWTIISRTIVPIIWQDDIFPEAGDQFGIGDVLQSFFFTPSAPTAGGIIWGAGPVFRLPTATDDLLGAEKWGLGPSAIALRQAGVRSCFPLRGVPPCSGQSGERWIRAAGGDNGRCDGGRAAIRRLAASASHNAGRSPRLYHVC